MAKSLTYFLLALAAIFTAGKLTGNIDWAWWVVLLPILAPAVSGDCICDWLGTCLPEDK